MGFSAPTRILSGFPYQCDLAWVEKVCWITFKIKRNTVSRTRLLRTSGRKLNIVADGPAIDAELENVSVELNKYCPVSKIFIAAGTEIGGEFNL